QDNQCHVNSVKLWLSEEGRYTIATGYGLSDNIWLRHTWLLQRHDRGGLVETTVKRVKYFGITLTDEVVRRVVRTWGYTSARTHGRPRVSELTDYLAGASPSNP